MLYARVFQRCVTLFITPPHERVKNHLAPACYHHALIHCQPYGREKIWPEVRDDNGDNDELSDAQAQPPSSFRDMVSACTVATRERSWTEYHSFYPSPNQ